MKCPICNNVFTPNPNGLQKYCGSECKSIKAIWDTFEVDLNGAINLYNRKLNMTCECCGKTETRLKGMQIDHCHKHGHVRGVVCKSCNQIFGRIENNKHVVNDKQHHYEWLY